MNHLHPTGSTTGEAAERRRNSYSLLSVVGAGIAGAGVGSLFASWLLELAWPILVVGLIAHSVGMLGMRRAMLDDGYRPSRWEQVTYWGCWVAIAAVLAVWIARRLS